MIKNEEINLHKDWKIVKQIELNKKLERKLEEILEKRVDTDSENEIGGYKPTRRSIFRKRNS